MNRVNPLPGKRVLLGAGDHYLTDTIVGFAVGLIMLAGLCHILFPIHSKMS